MRTGTGRRVGSSRSRTLRKPCGSATGRLHDPLPDLRAVEVEALRLGRGADVEDTLVVARKHDGEPVPALRPGLEEPFGHRRLGPVAVRLEQAAKDLLVVVPQRNQVDEV